MRRRIRSSILVALCATVLSGCFGAPAPIESATAPVAALPAPADPLPLDELGAFSGIAAMNAGSNCTGTLIDTGVPAGPAYVLTNGHCVGDVGRSPQQTTLDEPWSGTAEFLRAKGNLGATRAVEVVQLAYSTMRLTDTAIVRLEGTLGDLEQLGIRPVRISATEPSAGVGVVNVGVPVQNLDHDEWVLRRGACTLGAQHAVIEFHWLWRGVWSNDCPGIIQGSSGSPLLALDADGAPSRIVGLINTTTGGVSAAQGGACWLNRPCELTTTGARFVEGTSYAQSVAGIDACFDTTTGVFATGGACPLPVSDIWTENGSGGSFRGGSLPDATGGLPQVRLVGRSQGQARTALVPLGDGTACEDPATYQGAQAVALPAAGEPWEQKATPQAVALPEVEGRYALCAVRGTDYEGAATVLFEVDRTPPLQPAGAVVEDVGESVIVVPTLDPPELAAPRFTWGPKGTVACDDPSAFQDFFIVPLTIPHDELPATYCVYAMDSAGNATPVTRIEIPRP